MKKIMMVLLIGFFLFFTVSCSENTFISDNGEAVTEILELALADVPERKIIYEVDASFDVADLDAAADTLKALVEGDEWFDQEIIRETRITYVIRIKTARLDTFTTALKNEFTVRSYSKIGNDISLEYQNSSNRVLALEAQLARLLVLYESATIEEMILINNQISDIEVELQELEGDLALFDSLVDYSVVTVDLYGGTVATKSPFFNRLGNAFVTGFKAIITFFDGLIIVLATASPFLILIAAIGITIGLIVKKNAAKARLKKEQSGKKPE
jgi:hypothetical protein